MSARSPPHDDKRAGADAEFNASSRLSVKERVAIIVAERGDIIRPPNASFHSGVGTRSAARTSAERQRRDLWSCRLRDHPGSKLGSQKRFSSTQGIWDRRKREIGALSTENSRHTCGYRSGAPRPRFVTKTLQVGRTSWILLRTRGAELRTRMRGRREARR